MRAPQTIRRPGFRGSSVATVTPKSLGAALKLWLRADLGYNAGAKTWTDQAAGKVFTSAGTPSQVAEPLFGGQAVIQFGVGGGDVFAGDAQALTAAAPWCWLMVARITSGVAQYNAIYSTDNTGQVMMTPTDGNLYSRTATAENVVTSGGSAVGASPFVATMGSGLNVARLNGVALTHAALTGAQTFATGATTQVNYTVCAGQVAEIVLASAVDVMALAPYIKARYGLTL